MTSQVIFLLLGASLSFLWIIVPVKKARHLKIQDDFLKKLHAFKLIAVRRAYPSLTSLSYEEIEDKYNLDEIYDLIGKNRIRE